MFKVGDKVCDPIYGINGTVYEFDILRRFPVFVQFDNGESFAYTADGLSDVKERSPRLCHGHMEPGTGKLTFTPKKDPEYMWQWEYKQIYTSGGFSIEVTGHFSNEENMLARYKNDYRSDYIRIERSKKEVKS